MRSWFLGNYDFPGEVAEEILAYLWEVSTRPVFLSVEVDGERRSKISDEVDPRVAEKVGALVESMAGMVGLPAEATISLLVFSKQGREKVKGVGATTKLTPHHRATIALLGFDRPAVARSRIESMLARVAEYRTLLPSMRPTHDAEAAKRQKTIRRDRSEPMPLRNRGTR